MNRTLTPALSRSTGRGGNARERLQFIARTLNRVDLVDATREFLAAVGSGLIVKQLANRACHLRGVASLQGQNARDAELFETIRVVDRVEHQAGDGDLWDSRGQGLADGDDA